MIDSGCAFAYSTRDFVHSQLIKLKEAISFWSVRKSKPKSTFRVVSETMTTINFATACSLLEANDFLTAEILALLTEPQDGEAEGWAGLRALDAAEIAQKTKAIFALELRPLLSEDLRPRVASIAGAILDGFRALEITPEAEAAPATSQPQQPLEVKVQLPTSLEDMRLSELLSFIAANPGEAMEATEVLKNNPVVIKASRKTLKYAIAVQGTLSAALTGEYLGHLAKDGTSALPKYKGQRPVTLEVALGLESRLLVHPFTGEAISGIEPVTGEYDFADLSEELHLALIWARTTKHRAWPANPDLYECIPQIFANPLTGRWATILEDYQHAKASADDSTEGLSRYWNQQKELQSLAGEILGILNSVSEPQVTRNPWQNQPTPAATSEQQYKALLEENAGKVWAPNAHSQRPRHKVVMGVNVTAHSCNLNGIVSLGPVTLRAHSTYGTVYILRGTDFDDLAHSNAGVNVVELGTYQELARTAGLI